MKYRHALQNDRWVIEDVYAGMRGGYFVECGATNGIRASGTCVLEKHYGWDGICVEANDAQYPALVRNRSCRTDNRALYSESDLTLEFVALSFHRGRSGLERHLRPTTRELAEAEGTSLQKKTVSLFDLLQQHDAPEVVHYVCLDVEGAEAAILGAFPFDAPHKLLALSIEGRFCDEILSRNGYRRVQNPHTTVTYETYYLHADIDRYRIG
jgi:FkbM family methyltransferase